MNELKFDVLALGNAIVDVVGSADDNILVSEKLAKGTMSLIDEERAQSLLARLPHAAHISGGSAANTAVGVCALGGRAAFAGKVKNDSLGQRFKEDIAKAGVFFKSMPNVDGPSTARCLVFVTPDGERTMGTYLGACLEFTSNDVDPALISRSSVVYMEGYLWDPPMAKEAFRRAAHIARQTGSRIALSLSDPFCVDRYRDEFLELLNRRQIDVLFANRHEITSLWQTSDLETALDLTQSLGILAVVTKSEEGCVIIEEKVRLEIPAFAVERVVDATGAGDLFAAGFLVGLSRGKSLEDCGRLGALAASEAIGHFGARPQADLESLAQRVGLMP